MDLNFIIYHLASVFDLYEDHKQIMHSLLMLIWGLGIAFGFFYLIVRQIIIQKDKELDQLERELGEILKDK
jgi:hypothetical protein